MGSLPTSMTDRERFVAQMHYQPMDRPPICDFGYWRKTVLRWRREGLPLISEPPVLFGLDASYQYMSPNLNLLPAYEAGVLEDLGDRQRCRDPDGTEYIRYKDDSSLPHYVGYPVSNRNEWEQFKRRLDPQTPGRIPADWPQRCRARAERDYPLTILAGSLYGWPRNWMGVEALSKSLFRDPGLFADMTATLGELFATVLDDALAQARAAGLTFDAAELWEDMCFCDGPLISPKWFERCMAPQYRRIGDVLRKHGVDVIMVDSDGDISKLAELWLDAGVNCLIPMEVGRWGGDPVAYRRRYGRGCLMMGGFDKRILADSPRAIEAEIDRLAPLVAEGGYIPHCDHRVPPDVPLANYLHYVERAKAVWGRGVNIRPTWRPSRGATPGGRPVA